MDRHHARQPHVKKAPRAPRDKKRGTVYTPGERRSASVARSRFRTIIHKFAGAGDRLHLRCAAVEPEVRDQIRWKTSLPPARR